MRTGEQPLRGVGQDKRASTCERIATMQPAPPKNVTRSRHMNILFLRSQKNFNDAFLTDISSVSFTHSLAWVHMSYPAPDAQAPSHSRKHSNKRQLVQLTIWLTPPVKAEIQRIAEREGLSISQTGRAGLEEWVRQKLHIQHAVLLQPIIETTIRQELRGMMKKLVFMLSRNAYEAGWTRRIASNMLKYADGIMTEEKLNTILDRSSIDAKKHIFRKTPETLELSKAIERWLLEGEKQE